ncbi:MAG: TIGR02099 family protein [Pseudomonadales bacterium]|nr:TIGR02099 family protein [Pseudomonadales bacterium]
MKRVASGVVRGLLSLVVVFVVLSAIFVGVARELVYQVDDFKPELLAFVNQRFGLQVELESIAGSWKGLAPRFTLNNVSVRLANSESEAPRIETLDLEILLLRSLFSLEPRVRLRVDGAEGHAWSQDGHIVLGGFDTFAPSPEDSGDTNKPAKSNPLLDKLLAQPRIEIRNSRLVVADLYSEPVTLTLHEFRTEAGKRLRYVLGDFTAHGPSDFRFALKGRVSGSVFSKGTLNGGLYLHADGADWLPWIPEENRSISAATLQSLQGGASAWINFRAGDIEEIVTDFAIDDVELSSKNDIKPPHILDLKGKARWAGDLTEWRLDLQDIRMQTSRFLWMPSFMNLQTSVQQDGQIRYRIKIDDMDIEPWVNYYLGTQSRDSQLHQTLSKLRPAGQLQDVAIELFLVDKEVADYRFALTLNAFQNRPWKFIPGLYDLDMRAWGKKGLTLFRVDETYLELNYPQLFRDVLTVNYVDANILLRNLDDQWWLQSGPMYVNSKYAQSATQMSLSVPKDKTISPFLQLQATLRNADGKHKSLYLPAGIIQESLLKWLDEAIVDGHLMRGDILVHGPVRRDEAELRRVLLGFTARDAELQFLPDWKEPVRQGVADVVVDQGEVDARVLEGTYYGQQVKAASVTLPRYDRTIDEPHILSVRAETEGPADQAFTILAKSPLRQKIGDFIEDLTLQGEVGVQFSLDVPLQSEYSDQIQSTTEVQLRAGTLGLTSQNLTLSDANAEVQFDLQQGLSARKIEGRFLGGQLQGKMKTVGKQKGKSVQLEFDGNSSVKAIRNWREIPFLELAAGPLDYSALVSIPLTAQSPGHKTSPQLTIRSQLEKVVVNAPEPFGKQANNKRLFNLKMDLGTTPSELNIQYGEVGNVALLLGEQGLQRGAILLGSGEAALPSSDILQVKGTLTRFDDQEWKPLLQSKAQPNVQPKGTDAVTPGADNQQNDIVSMLDDSELRIHDLTLQGFPFGQTDLRMTRGQGYWHVWLNNDLATGKLELPDYLFGPWENLSKQTQPLVINLERLHVSGAKEVAESSSDSDNWQPADVSPATLPPMNVSIDQFTVGEARFGRWTLQAQPTANGMQVNNLNAQLDGVTLRGQAHWTESQAGQRRTRFVGRAAAANAADAIKAMGGTPTLSSKSAEAKGDVSWPGAPFEFALSRLAGDVSVKLKSGVFYNVSSNAAGKLWGLLNFETLMRRLQLDFDDLSESEMVYDEFSGDIKLDRGVLHLSRVKLNSPSIKMNAEGKVDVEHEALSMGLDVTLPVTRNLVLPAAVIGGVPAAATAFVVEKMFGDQFDKLTTIKYDIKGTFDQPEISVKDSFSIIPKQVGEAVMRSDKPAPGASQEGLPQDATPPNTPTQNREPQEATQ